MLAYPTRSISFMEDINISREADGVFVGTCYILPAYDSTIDGLKVLYFLQCGHLIYCIRHKD